MKVEQIIKNSMNRELQAIQLMMEKQRFVNAVAPGRDVYNAMKKDCAEFTHSSPESRMRFAMESGLYPRE